MSYKNITDENLILQTENEIRLERRSTLKIIKLFQEIYDRKLYLERGFPSFYEMVTKQFGYCAGSAMRRINAMKLVKDLPQFEEKIETGELSLSVAADVQTFLYQEARIERPYSTNAKIELVETCLRKSRREVEEEFARRNPEREKRESSYAVSHDRLRVSFSISKELNDKIDQLKDLLSHVVPTMTTETLLGRLVELGLDKYDPQRKSARAKARKEKQSSAGTATSAAEVPPESDSRANFDAAGEVELTPAQARAARTRYIPADERHQILYDGGGCAYTDPSRGRRCRSTKFLQMDHIEPFARGGAHVKNNLRWLCGAHNRFRVERKKSSMDSIASASIH